MSQNETKQNTIMQSVKREALFSTAIILTVMSFGWYGVRYVGKLDLQEKHGMITDKINEQFLSYKKWYKQDVPLKTTIQSEVVNRSFETAYGNFFLTMEPLPVLQEIQTTMNTTFPKEVKAWTAGQREAYDWVKLSIKELKTGQKSTNQFFVRTVEDLLSPDFLKQPVTNQHPPHQTTSKQPHSAVIRDISRGR